MKFMCAIGAMLLLAVFLKADARPEETAAALTDPTFKAFLAEFEKGTTAFINGDNSLWLQNASRATM